jgi:hypothetical protein
MYPPARPHFMAYMPHIYMAMCKYGRGYAHAHGDGGGGLGLGAGGFWKYEMVPYKHQPDARWTGDWLVAGRGDRSPAGGSARGGARIARR